MNHKSNSYAHGLNVEAHFGKKIKWPMPRKSLKYNKG